MKERTCYQQVIKKHLPDGFSISVGTFGHVTISKGFWENKIAYMRDDYDPVIKIYDKNYYELFIKIAKDMEKNKVYKYSEVEIVKCWEGA